MRVKTVNLVEIATGFSGEAKVESHYKRLQRFFRGFEVDYESIALMVIKVMKIPEPWVISIDRTDWKFGKTVFKKPFKNYLLRSKTLRDPPQSPLRRGKNLILPPS